LKNRRPIGGFTYWGRTT